MLVVLQSARLVWDDAHPNHTLSILILPLPTLSLKTARAGAIDAFRAQVGPIGKRARCKTMAGGADC